MCEGFLSDMLLTIVHRFHSLLPQHRRHPYTLTKGAKLCRPNPRVKNSRFGNTLVPHGQLALTSCAFLAADGFKFNAILF